MMPTIRNRVLLGLSWVTLGHTQAVEKPPSARFEVAVHVYNEARVPGRLLKKAESEAARLFGEAHISIRWVHCPLSDSERRQYPECDEAVPSPLFFLKILPEAMAKSLAKAPHEYGLALQTQAYVYFDRLKNRVEDVVPSVGPPLGHIIAHEIGHLLLGPDSHAAEGIMRPHWSNQEWEKAVRGRLHFSPHEIRQMHSNIAAWTIRTSLRGALCLTHRSSSCFCCNDCQTAGLCLSTKLSSCFSSSVIPLDHPVMFWAKCSKT